MLARAERLHRQFFEPAARRRPAPGLGAAGRHAGDRARGPGPRRAAGRRPRPRSRRRSRTATLVVAGTRVLPARTSHRRHPPAGAAAGPVRAPGAAAGRPLQRGPRAPAPTAACWSGSRRPAERRRTNPCTSHRTPPAPRARLGTAAGASGGDARAAAGRADHPAGARPGAVPRRGHCRSRSAGRARSPPCSRRCASSASDRPPDAARPAGGGARARDLHRIGTVANVLRYVTAPDGTHHLVCQGEQRFRVLEFSSGWPFFVARVHAASPSRTRPHARDRGAVPQPAQPGARGAPAAAAGAARS